MQTSYISYERELSNAELAVIDARNQTARIRRILNEAAARGDHDLRRKAARVLQEAQAIELRAEQRLAAVKSTEGTGTR